MSIANLIMDQGQTFMATITVKNPDGTAFNLTGYSIHASMRPSMESNVVYDLSPSFTRNALGMSGANLTTAGIITFRLLGSDTEKIRHGKYYYICTITKEDIINNTINEYRVCEGTITVLPQPQSPGPV